MKPYYQDDLVTIYHGDCREIVPQLGKFDLLLTDPPYGILNLQGKGSTPAIRKSPRQMGSGKLKNRILNVSNVKWDIAPKKETFDLLIRMTEYQIIWGGNYFEFPPCRGFLIWDKAQPWENFSQAEFAWTNLNIPSGIIKISTTNGNPNKKHPTQKPVPLMTWCILKSPTPKTILDPFAGSGSTGVAAKSLGCTCTMIEIDEKYCEIAAKRMPCQKNLL